MHRAPLMLAVVLALTACAGAPGGAHPSVPSGPEAAAPDDIRGEWLLTEVVQDGETVPLPDGVELRFVPRPPVLADDLLGTSWLLQGVTADGLGTIALGAPALLDFRPDGTFRAGTGCGAVSGHVGRAAGRRLVVGRVHESDCPAELREQDEHQDEHVATVFAHGFEAGISHGRLTLTDSQGRSVEYVDSADRAYD